MFDSTSDKPLYLQLVDVLELKIRETMKPNEKLFSERELTQVYGVSRITVRLALQELEKRGFVYKKHGKGTYVSEILEPAVDLSTAYSFTDQMRKMGKRPQTKILSFRTIEASDFLSVQLQVEIGSAIIELERLRLADGIAMMLERTYLPYHLFENLTVAALERMPLYELFSEEFGQTVRLAEEEFYASIALENEAKLLEIKNGSPVLHLIRKTFNNKNRMIEYTFSIARADLFRYKISHVRSD
ncbi:GntR family transcriptional regulator [Streptococcus suis]|nr:GntR family transcriptional regulator [Streptococcus suis]